MNKIKRNYLILIGILVVVYNVLVFAVPYPHKSEYVFITVWVSGLVAILFQIYFAFVAFSNKETLKSKFYGLPIVRVGLIYLVTQLILTILFLIVGAFVKIPYWIVIIPVVIILALALIGLIVADTYRDGIETIEECIPTNTDFINNLKVDVAIFAKKYIATPIIEKIEIFNDEVKYSDPVSSEALIEIEEEIELKYTELKTIIVESKFEKCNLLLDDLINLIQERNMRCKRNKK